MPPFEAPLELEYIDGKKWKVTKEFTYHLRDTFEYVRVPEEFITDFASIPKIFQNILSPTGSYGKAAVIHDWLYQHRSICNGTTRLCERGEADSVLKEAMEALNVGWWTKWTIYSGVRVGGWKPWGGYRDAEAKEQ